MSDKVQKIYIEKGIIKIKDVIERNCKFKTMEEITGEFQVEKSTFMSYQSIIHSIPQLYRRQEIRGIYRYNN